MNLYTICICEHFFNELLIQNITKQDVKETLLFTEATLCVRESESFF